MEGGILEVGTTETLSGGLTQVVEAIEAEKEEFIRRAAKTGEKVSTELINNPYIFNSLVSQPYPTFEITRKETIQKYVGFVLRLPAEGKERGLSLDAMKQALLYALESSFGRIRLLIRFYYLQTHNTEENSR